ncbi:MAG: VTT domain-containing protein [Vicinamibacterales bacterium]
MIDFVLHFDTHLLGFIAAYGSWVYGLLFAIIFAETGLVVTPFLPGDSLLFATGAVAATGALNPWLAFALLAAAAFTGNVTNYAAGRAIGPRVFTATEHGALITRLMNRDHLARAHEFFERYGGRSIVLGRFVPVVRTFVPFVAGAGAMTWGSFILYNALGALGWVGLCLVSGVVFGNVPAVKNHFSLVTLGIVAVSLLPMLVEFIRHRARMRTSQLL